MDSYEILEVYKLSFQPVKYLQPKPATNTREKQTISSFRPIPENIEHMKELLLDGKSPITVAEELKCSEKTVLNWRKKFVAEWNGIAPAEDRRKYNRGPHKIINTENFTFPDKKITNKEKWNPFQQVKKKSAGPLFQPTPENIDCMRNLLEQGLTPMKVALKLKCSEKTVHIWQNRFKAEWTGALAEDRRQYNNRGLKRIPDEQFVVAVQEMKCNPSQSAEKLPEVLRLNVTGRAMRKVLKGCANFMTNEQMKKNPHQSAQKLPEVLGLKVTEKIKRKVLRERANFIYNKKFKKLEPKLPTFSLNML